jgi:hypothetical protein
MVWFDRAWLMKSGAVRFGREDRHSFPAVWGAGDAQETRDGETS